MVWYKYLYADERISRKKEKIKWKVCHNAGQINLYLVTLSRGPGKLLEIVSTLTLMQRAYPKEGLFNRAMSRPSVWPRRLFWRSIRKPEDLTSNPIC